MPPRTPGQPSGGNRLGNSWGGSHPRTACTECGRAHAQSANRCRRETPPRARPHVHKHQVRFSPRAGPSRPLELSNALSSSAPTRGKWRELPPWWRRRGTALRDGSSPGRWNRPINRSGLCARVVVKPLTPCQLAGRGKCSVVFEEAG